VSPTSPVRPSTVALLGGVIRPIDFAGLEKTIAKTPRHIEFLRDARQRQVAAERACASLSRYFSPNLAKQLASDTDAIESHHVVAHFTS
jgi:hypothetical protein